MERNNGRTFEDQRKGERRGNHNHRESQQRERNPLEDSDNYFHYAGGYTRHNATEHLNTVPFDSYHQQQLQQQFQRFQLAEKARAEEISSRSANRRMGAAVLPSPTPPGSIKSRAASVCSSRRDRCSLLCHHDDENDVTPCDSRASILEPPPVSKYYQDSVSNSGKKSVNKGNGVMGSQDSEVDDYDEIDAATSTSITNGKINFFNKIFDKPPTTSKEKSEKSLKKEKKSNKSVSRQEVESKVSSVNDFDNDSRSRSRKSDSSSYMSKRKSAPNPFLDDDTETIYDPELPSHESSKASIKSSRKIRQVSSKHSKGNVQLLSGASSNSFVSPSALNSSYDLIYAEARRAVDSSGNILESSSAEILPLPIEIPDSVTNDEAFRRYLSVRRGATCNPPPPPFLSLPIPTQHSNVGSTGEQRGTKSSSRTPVNQKEKVLIPGDAHKRTLSLSHAIMTLALLCASASQLRFFIAYSHAHSYPGLNYFLVCSCIIIEIVVGIGYLLLSRFTMDEERAELIHSFLIFGLFFVAAANVIICAFALDDHICEVLARNSELYDSVDQSLSAGKMK